VRCAILLCLLVTLLPALDARAAVLVYQRRGSRDIVAAYATGSHARVIARGEAPVVSPDGRRVVFIKSRRSSLDLYVVSTKGGRARLLARDAVLLSEPPSDVWSPDNRHVVAGDLTGYGGFVLDVIRRTRRTVSLESDFGGGSFSPSGKQFAMVDAQPRRADVYLFASDGSHQRHLAVGNFPVWGRRGIAFTAANAVVLKAAPRKHARTLLRPAPPDSALPIAWSADGNALLAAQGQSFDSLSAVVIDPRTGATQSPPGTFSSVDGLSRDGSSILAETGGNVVTVRSDGEQRVVARAATTASWTR
jgi:hypothetical protein